MKKLLPRLVIVAAVILTGCQQVVPEDKPFQTFVNKKYGYSIELPKTWGAIRPWGEAFTINLYDDLEEIGPYLPTAMDDNDRDQYYLSVEIFSDENSKREPNESWFDFYKKLRLADYNYHEQKWDETTRQITLFRRLGRQKCGLIKTGESEDGLSFETRCFDYNNDDEFYMRTCRLIEHAAKLYSFCYNQENNIHVDIMKSLKFE